MQPRNWLQARGSIPERAGARRAVRCLAVLLAVLGSLATPAPAQQDPTVQVKALLLANRDQRETIGDGIVTLMAGRLGGEFVKVADDIAAVVSDSQSLRVLLIAGDGGAQNIRDLVLWRNADLALTQVATLNRMMATEELGPSLEQQIQYVTTLFHDELHVLVRPGIRAVAELNGKRVNFGTSGSGADYLVPAVFEALGLKVQKLNLSQTDAISGMRRGEVDATVCICLKPAVPFINVKPEWGLKLIGVPFAPALEREYLPARLESTDYPNLIAGADKIDTIALRSALVAFNWPRNSARYNKIARFVETMFSNFGAFSRPGRHERWAGVNFAASVPGWQRFPAAQDWLDRNAQTMSAELQKEFNRFITERGRGPRDANLSLTAGNERLFREFLQWRLEQRR